MIEDVSDVKYCNCEFKGFPRTDALNRGTPAESENLVILILFIQHDHIISASFM